MNDILSKVVIFAAGAAVGSFAAWRILKPYYKRIADEEIESMRGYYSEKNQRTPVVDSNAEKTQNILTEEDYKAIIRENNYETEVKEMNKPYVISPDEFGEIDEYETISLTYYSDGVLADDMDHPIEDVDGTVGEDSLNHFGEYEDDSVFVRNDKLGYDYEILLDQRKYFDVINRRTHPTEVE